jgi:hypothetical protein
VVPQRRFGWCTSRTVWRTVWVLLLLLHRGPPGHWVVDGTGGLKPAVVFRPPLRQGVHALRGCSQRHSVFCCLPPLHTRLALPACVTDYTWCGVSGVSRARVVCVRASQFWTDLRLSVPLRIVSQTDLTVQSFGVVWCGVVAAGCVGWGHQEAAMVMAGWLTGLKQRRSTAEPLCIVVQK